MLPRERAQAKMACSTATEQPIPCPANSSRNGLALTTAGAHLGCLADVVTPPCGVGCRQDARPGVELRRDARFCDRDRLLLHDFVDRCAYAMMT